MLQLKSDTEPWPTFLLFCLIFSLNSWMIPFSPYCSFLWYVIMMPLKNQFIMIVYSVRYNPNHHTVQKLYLYSKRHQKHLYLHLQLFHSCIAVYLRGRLLMISGAHRKNRKWIYFFLAIASPNCFCLERAFYFFFLREAYLKGLEIFLLNFLCPPYKLSMISGAHYCNTY